MIELKRCREKIDTIDLEILRLFEERMRIVKYVVYIKKAKGIGICNCSREADLISAIKAMSEDGLSEYDKALFEKIMELSKLYQSRCLEE